MQENKTLNETARKRIKDIENGVEGKSEEELDNYLKERLNDSTKEELQRAREETDYVSHDEIMDKYG